MIRTPWTGCGTALVTPFTAAGDVDVPALRRLVRRQIDAGIHFLVPCGTTGESPTLSEAERLHVIAVVVEEAAGQVPILAGAGGNNTSDVIRAARAAAGAGASGILSVTPYYNKPTQEGLVQHYRAIAEAAEVPVVVYNVPGRTGCNIEVGTLTRLAALPNIAGVKEASGNMAQIAEACAAVPPGFVVLSGDDALTLPVMAVGGRGVISVASNQVPAEMARLVERAEAGDFAGARALHTRLLPLMQVNFVEANPIPVKAALAMMGLLTERYRLPLVPPSEASRARVAAALASMGLLDARAPAA